MTIYSETKILHGLKKAKLRSRLSPSIASSLSKRKLRMHKEAGNVRGPDETIGNVIIKLYETDIPTRERKKMAKRWA